MFGGALADDAERGANAVMKDEIDFVADSPRRPPTADRATT